MISQLGCMSYYNRETDNEEIILEVTIIKVSAFNEEPVTGRFMRVEKGVLLLDISKEFNHKILHQESSLISKIEVVN